MLCSKLIFEHREYLHCLAELAIHNGLLQQLVAH